MVESAGNLGLVTWQWIINKQEYNHYNTGPLNGLQSFLHKQWLSVPHVGCCWNCAQLCSRGSGASLILLQSYHSIVRLNKRQATGLACGQIENVRLVTCTVLPAWWGNPPRNVSFTQMLHSAASSILYLLHKWDTSSIEAPNVGVSIF